jgi:hypothetical protein
MNIIPITENKTIARALRKDMSLEDGLYTHEDFVFIKQNGKILAYRRFPCLTPANIDGIPFTAKP